MKTKINNLTLILSCGCNLSCEYCLIAQSVNSNSAKVQAKTREFLSNGYFLQNCIDTIKILGQDPADIEHFQFWGQEPTLNLDLYTKDIENWHKNFPNIKTYMFSTNGKAYPEKIVSFLTEVDKYSNPETYIELQFSYDGNYSNNNLRKIDSDIIEKNLKYIISQINNIDFKNISVDIHFNGVITRELIYELNTINKIKTFIENGSTWLNQFNILNKNPKVHISTGIPFSPEVPYLCTVDDGIQLNKFYSLLKQIDTYHVKDFIANFLRGYNHRIQALHESGYTQISMIDALKFLSNLNFKSEEQKNLYTLLSPSYYCGSNYNSLKIMYDGTLLECHNLIFDTELEYIKANTDEEFLMKKNIIEKDRIINLLKNNNSQTIEKFLYRGEQMEVNSFFSTLNETINLLYMMSRCGQAEKDYLYNKEKLLLHAYILTRLDTCTHDRRICTGSAYFINTGMIRFFCNGFLSSAVDEEGRIKELIENE